jgi:hypothetical protein
MECFIYVKILVGGFEKKDKLDKEKKNTNDAYIRNKILMLFMDVNVRPLVVSYARVPLL